MYQYHIARHNQNIKVTNKSFKIVLDLVMTVINQNCIYVEVKTGLN